MASEELHLDYDNETRMGFDPLRLRRSLGAAPRSPRVFGPRRAVKRTGVPAAEVPATSTAVAAYVDGCQNVQRLVYREHRPIVLRWAAAAALGPGDVDVRAFSARFDVVCSYLDSSWVRGLPGDPTVVELDEHDPWDLEEAIGAEVESVRRLLEVATALSVPAPGIVVIDGDLRGLPHADERLVAVAKSHVGQYLDDERGVFDLDVGWRSEVFVLPPRRRGEYERLSAYVRLLPAADEWWGFGLVRVEARSLAGIEAAASIALTNRQPLGADRRENHLRSFAAVERLLKARRPPVFDVGTR